jgi:hypothetical protein
MSLLTKTEIMAAENIGGEVIEVPEWGGSLRLLLLAPNLMDRWGEDEMGDHPYARLLSRLIVDERGVPVLTEDELRRCNYATIKRLAERALKRRCAENGGADSLQ